MLEQIFRRKWQNFREDRAGASSALDPLLAQFGDSPSLQDRHKRWCRYPWFSSASNYGGGKFDDLETSEDASVLKICYYIILIEIVGEIHSKRTPATSFDKIYRSEENEISKKLAK